jgi:hypothetical protein
MDMAVMIPVSWGELFDKLTILEIKRVRIEDPDKLDNIKKELAALSKISRDAKSPGPGLDGIIVELRSINEQLWDIEDDIRACERTQDFSAHFVELARSVYRTNDRRAQLKRQINQLLGSELVEEKSYQAY